MGEYATNGDFFLSVRNQIQNMDIKYSTATRMITAYNVTYIGCKDVITFDQTKSPPDIPVPDYAAQTVLAYMIAKRPPSCLLG